MGLAAFTFDTVRAAAWDPARVGQYHMALWAPLWASGPAPCRPHERPLHQQVRSPASFHRRRSVLHRRRRFDHRSLRRHRLVVRRHHQTPPLGCRRFRFRVLDFGCGSGRDTKYFISKGYDVEATDGSEELCRIATDNTGIKARHMLFSELDEYERYDGIWACSSVLHLPKSELKNVFRKMIHATKPGGYIYMSFKYGEFEGYRNGRYFTDFTEESFDEFIGDFTDIVITEKWVSSDVRPDRGNEKWLNLILQKLNTL